jgi:hypothetical protein
MSTTESILHSIFRIRDGVEGVVIEEGLLEVGHAAEGGERAGEAVHLEAEAPERGEVGEGGRELADEAKQLEVEVVTGNRRRVATSRRQRCQASGACQRWSGTCGGLAAQRGHRVAWPRPPPVW